MGSPLMRMLLVACCCTPETTWCVQSPDAKPVSVTQSVRPTPQVALVEYDAAPPAQDGTSAVPETVTVCGAPVSLST